MLKKDIDKNPYTGVREVNGKLRIKTDKWIKHYFDGTRNFQQVENVTMGKIYDVVRIKGLGDSEDVTIINDIGEETVLADFFFEEVN